MKKIILILIILLSVSCEEPKQVYETSIKTYTISNKDSYYVRPRQHYFLYFQTPISTEKASVDLQTYQNHKVGDTIQILIKYWEKPKK